MTNDKDLLMLMKQIKIADALSVGEILHSHGIYSTLQSARVNAQKQLNKLADLGLIERKDHYYRLPGCKSEYLEHSRLLTRSLTELLKISGIACHIHREITIPEIALRPDCISLIIKENKGLCIILETVHNEAQDYLQKKVNAWRYWPDSLAYLSQLFGYKIPFFDITVDGAVLDGCIPYKQILEEVSK